MRRFTYSAGGTVLLIAACSAALGGCLGSTPPARFYLLTPIEVEGPEEPQVASSENPAGPSVFLAAVEVPRYLADPQIVTRVDGNELEFAEFERWGEPLHDNVTRVLGRNLSALLPGSSVANFVWERPDKVDRLVTVAVTRFDAEDREVRLAARWTVSGGDSASSLGLKRTEYVQPVQGEGYAAIVRAMSAALEKLSRDIADELRR
jgi:uncharacterized lipoprotein YmbA